MRPRGSSPGGPEVEASFRHYPRKAASGIRAFNRAGTNRGSARTQRPRESCRPRGVGETIVAIRLEADLHAEVDPLGPEIIRVQDELRVSPNTGAGPGRQLGGV